MRNTILFCLSFLFATWGQTPQYCLSCGPTTTVDSNLGSVTLQGDTSAITDDSNCPGFIGPKDLTALKADVHTNGTYKITFTVTTCGNSFPTLAAAWIDYNQNGLWEDFERLGPFTTAKNAVEQTFTVPVDAKAGQTRMRVQVQETQATSIDPCAAFPYGATKDYSVVVGGGGGCKSGPESTDDTNLGAVSLAGDSKVINEQSDCPGKIGPQDFKSLVADLTQGYSYTLTYQVTTCGKTWPSLSGAWIDWFNDYTYGDEDLLAPLSSAEGAITINFKVPANTTVGNTTLRVQVQESYSPVINPCADFAYGGTKDFTITLKNSSSNYCRSGPSQVGQVALGAVALDGVSQNISNNDGCPGVVGPQDLTQQTADVVIGGAYQLTYNVLNCTTAQPAVISAAWIDFDQNLVFSSWEQISVDNKLYGQTSSIFKVPVSTPTQEVKTGRTRLRVQVQQTNNALLDACAQFAVGGTKDFSITISGGVATTQ